MARLKVQQNAIWPYHITDRCPNREHFRLNPDDVWNILCDYLYLANKKYGLIIHAFVLMPNHFHLIASIGEFPIGKIMCEFLGESSRAMNAVTGRINQNWGGRNHKCVLDNYFYFMNTYKYLYQNPVRAGLCSRVEDWKYSSLHGLLGRSKLLLPLASDTILFNPDFVDAELTWLNTAVDQKHCADVRAALRKRSFILPKVNQRTHFLEDHRI